MEKEIKKILKKHSMFRDQENGYRVFTLYRDKWSDVAKDIESLVKKYNGIQNVMSCDFCESTERIAFNTSLGLELCYECRKKHKI